MQPDGHLSVLDRLLDEGRLCYVLRVACWRWSSVVPFFFVDKIAKQEPNQMLRIAVCLNSVGIGQTEHSRQREREPRVAVRDGGSISGFGQQG